MAQSGVSLGVEQLPRATGIAVCGLLIERGRVVLNQRLRAVGPLQGVGIEAVLEVEDERPVRGDGLLALDADIGLPESVRRDRVVRLTAVLLDQRIDPVRVVAVEWGAMELVARAIVEPPVEGDSLPRERAIVGTAGQKVIDAGEAGLGRRRRKRRERRLLARQIGGARFPCRERDRSEKRNGRAG